MQKDIQLFYCYDKRLHFHIKQHGIKSITIAKTLEDRIFTLYQCSEQLNQAIKSFNVNQKG